MNVLKRPYGEGLRPGFRFWQALIFGTFVFLFLWFFEPFGLNQLSSDLLPLSLGFGAVTFGVMLLFNVLLPIILPRWFSAEHWTVGKQVFWTVFNLSLIGLGNVLFFAWWRQAPLNWSFVLWFQGATWGVGAFPVLSIVLLRERRLRRRYERASADFKAPAKYSQPSADSLSFPSENKKEALSLAATDFRFARSADNYLEVHYLDGATEKMTLLRNSLKKLSAHFETRTGLFRCHKSYLVNLEAVVKITGNAQGYRLHFSDHSQSVPVSRQHNDFIKKHFTVAP